MSFMFQGICAEAGVLHKKNAKRKEKKREKKSLRVSKSTQHFFFDTDSNQPKQFF